ncbi:NAD(P)-binding protein [Linnemannia elongata AG-77]|uniref:NAD(P)-binding protein n=1 Tax=Linnemannia elongata AG-77 TaxID=1314771 RepID=A0A197JCG3_9FUNG|nr:NAD(P)-binding protein [Linnemannia elongata AG-77]
MSSAQDRIGWIGLGLLGFEMAQHLQKYLVSRSLPSLTVWNRSVDKAENFRALAPEVNISSSIEDLFSKQYNTNIIFTSLQNDAAVEQVYETLLRHAAEAKEQIVFVETGTLYPGLSLRLQKELASLPQRHIYLQCPVFGRPEAARLAQLVWVASGDASGIERLRPYFESMSRTVLDLKTADVSAGATLKLLGNYMIMANNSIMSESINLARKTNLDPQHFLSFISEFLPAPALMTYSQKLAGGEEDEVAVDMTVNIALKDVGTVRRWAEVKGAPTPVADAVYRNYALAKERGYSKNWNFLIDTINSQISS